MRRDQYPSSAMDDSPARLEGEFGPVQEPFVATVCYGQTLGELMRVESD